MYKFNKTSAFWIVISIILLLLCFGVFKLNSVNRELSSKLSLNALSLINKDLSSKLSNLPYAESHIASNKKQKPFVQGDPYIGTGMLYYSLAYSSLSKVAVVIGSGAGFVPKVVAQAQRDMGCEDAVTYLVDAYFNVLNIKTGQSYGQPTWNKSEKLADNIYTLNMRSSYAAKLFAKESIKIDYLHVDGDHSLKGILEDWHYYAPLLSENALITFHDYISVPDVLQALEKIKTITPNIEFIILPDTGAGSVIAQIGGLKIKSATEDKDRKLLLSYFNNGKHFLSTEDVFWNKEWSPTFLPNDPSSTFSYLQSEKFKERYKIVTDFIDDENIEAVELGGFPNSIVNFLHKTKKISIIEKYTNQSWLNDLSIKCNNKNIDLTIYPSIEDFSASKNYKYNLALLGVQLQYEISTDRQEIFNDVRKFFELLVHANKIAYEYSNYVHSVTQFNYIKEVFNPNIVEYKKMDNNNNDNNPIYIRNIYLIDGLNPKDNWNSEETINKMVDIIISGR